MIAPAVASDVSFSPGTAGIFITFEGSEGCGKSTQIRLLAESLEKAGHRVVLTREPGGTTVGESIRHLLQFSKEGHTLTAEAELLLFAASRAQLSRELIAPALAEGSIVLADRFFDSTTVYQGVARNLDAGAVAFINRFAIGPCMPDLTLIFDLDPAVARSRLDVRKPPAGAPDRMEQQPAEFYENVRAGYLRLAEAESERIAVLDASRSVEALQAEVEQLLESRFHGILEKRSA